jgi:hypothetical protein
MARLAKLSTKNQITLPVTVIKNHPGVEYFEVRDSGEAITLYPVKTQRKQRSALEEFRERVKKLGITEKDVEDAVKWARSKDAPA